jgi:hypothetical protein
MATRFEALVKGYLAHLDYQASGDQRLRKRAIAFLDAAGGVRDVPRENGGFLWLVKPEIESLMAEGDPTALPGRLETAFADWRRQRLTEASVPDAPP